MDSSNSTSEPEEIIVKPFHLEELDNFKNLGNIVLHMYCHDRFSNTVLLRIDNFRVYCCLELPMYTLEQIPSPDGDFKKATYKPKSYITWDFELIKKVYFTLCEKQTKGTNYKTGEPKEAPFDLYPNQFDDVYYYTGRKKQYLYLFFRTIAARNDMLSTIKYEIYVKGEGFMKFEMHENKITTFRRLLSKQNVKYTQWISVRGIKINYDDKDRISKKPLTEYIVDYSTMRQIDESITSKWFVYPKLFSWDGEMYSKNHKQMPSAKRPYDEIYLISVVFQYMEHESTRRKICLIKGECNDIEGVEVIRFETEKELLIAFFHLFSYLDPDIILGYNTTGFDYQYIIGRCERNEMSIEDMPSTGRLLNDKSSIFEMNWSSSGSGKNNYTMIKHKGRFDADMLPIIRRSYKLRQYTLQFVSMNFLNEGKHDIKAKDMFLIYEACKDAQMGKLSIEDAKIAVDRMTDVAAYCVQDSILPIKLFENRKTWYQLSSLSTSAGVSILELFTRGEQIRCYSNIADECYKRGKVLSNPQYFDYYFKGGFVGKPIPGVYKYVFTLDFASLYPSIMRAYNISIDSIIRIEDWTKFDENDYEVNFFEQEEPIDFVSSSYRKDLEEKYKILLKKQQLIDEYNLFLNGNTELCTYSSAEEYINIIKRHNVIFTQDDFTTMNEMGLKDSKRLSLNSENSIETIDYDPDYFEDKNDIHNGIGIYGGKIGVTRRYEIRIIKKSIYEGIMSTLETGWFQTRKNIKKLMKRCEESLKEKYDKLVDSERSVYDAGQNSQKIMMNSGYGFTGVAKGMLPALPVAILVTAIGRRLIGLVNEILLENFQHYNAKVVYNDTDSSMISLEINDEDVLSGKVNLKALMEEMEEITNGRPEKIIYNEDLTIKEVIPAIISPFRDELKMECENVCQMCPLKPKYYIKLHREVELSKILKNGPFQKEYDGKYKITTKGILTSKKGNSQFVNKVYDKLVNQVIFMKHICEILYSLSNNIYKFLSDKFPIKDLCRVTELGSDYKVESYFMNVFSQYLASQGMPVKAGDRLEYIVVRTRKEIETGKTENMGNKCREYTMWQADPDRENIDYSYYIEKGLQEQYDSLFSIGNISIINDERLADVGYRPQFSRCHFVHFKTPIKMVSAIISDYMKLSDSEFIQIYTSYGFEYSDAYKRNFYIGNIVSTFIDRICEYVQMFYPRAAI